VELSHEVHNEMFVVLEILKDQALHLPCMAPLSTSLNLKSTQIVSSSSLPLQSSVGIYTYLPG